MKQDRIIRKYNETLVGGVCSGISEYFGINVIYIRLLWFLSIWCYGIGVALYILLWILLPNDADDDW